ncbi:NAD-P-binding protein [Mycena amicta]|nr:NAD-P-binding protein [Mycena amicta]
MTLPQFSVTSTADDVASALSSEIAGKNVLVTGTSLNGIGFETARAIAKYANLVIITGYNAERLKLAEDALRAEGGSATIRPLLMDLSSLADVRRAASEVLGYPEPLHALIHNAAAVGGIYRLTPDGLEDQIATAQIGPFLLTKLLYPKLLESSSATWLPRVVYVSSNAHVHGTGVDLDPGTFRTNVRSSLTGEELSQKKEARAKSDPLVTFIRYTQVKSAVILTAGELARRGEGKLRAYSLHPGVIHTNIFDRESSIAVMKAVGIVTPDGKHTDQMPWKTIEEGAATTVVAAFDPRLDDKSGAYLDDCVPVEPAAHSSDPVIAAKVWTATEEIIGEKFEL